MENSLNEGLLIAETFVGGEYVEIKYLGIGGSASVEKVA